MTKDKFNDLRQKKELTMAELKAMNPKQRIEIRKNPLVYVVDADANGSKEFLGAFIREVINSKGEFK